jgi:uncharacterized protein (TIGR03435 family)
MERLATMVTGQMGRMVVDRTGLTGLWDFTLTYAREEPSTLPPAGDVPTAPDPGAPSIFTALQDQLGLKLEPTKGPMDVLVIDSVDRPTED